MITLPFSALTGTSQLFIDYCNDIPDAKRFFLGHFSDVMAYETHLQIIERRDYHRNELSRILERQNTLFGAGKNTIGNIKALRDATTCAVVTGQQVGLFTGPLYTIFKAMTTVRHAHWLKQQFPAYNFVPVFWLESEDHDLEEVSTVGVVDKENNFTRVRYGKPLEEGEKNYQSVGAMQFSAAIHETIDHMQRISTPTDFTTSALKKFRYAYAEGTTFAIAFAKLMNALYPKSGIVFLDPSDPEIKKILSPVISRELETFPTAGEEVIQRSAELETIYHAQIKPRAVNLFYYHRDGRYAIDPSEYGFFLRGTRQRFRRDELREIARTSPELFSPNVLLRPIAQDYLLPTVSYIAGPSEVAYFAQLQPVYDHFQVPMPIIFPRASITLIEPKIQKLFDKFDIGYIDMFLSPDQLYNNLSKNTDGEEALIMQELSTDLDSWQRKLREAAQKVDPSLASAADTTISKMKSHLTVFEQKIFQSKKQRDQAINRQLEKMQMYLNPEGTPQERQLNIFTFLNKYGFEVLDLIEKSCEPFPVEHRLVHI